MSNACCGAIIVIYKSTEHKNG